MAKVSEDPWIWDIFYYNPQDPDLWVAKQSGLGYTLNFANKFSWLIIFSVLLIIALARVLNIKGKQPGGTHSTD